MRYYNRIQIPKKNGGYRKISVPTQELRKIQEEILVNLDIKYLGIKKCFYSYRKKCSTFDNAQAHLKSKTNNDYIITIDLRDFFGHILDSQVKEVISYYYGKEKLNYKNNNITKYICDQNTLPIGALTSPLISNLVGHHYIDMPILEMLKGKNLFKYGIRGKMAGIYYTRYSDDLVFSCNKNTNKTLLVKDTIKHLKKVGFPVNFSKFRIQSKNGVQCINGININSGRPTIKKSKREDLYFYTKLFLKNSEDALKMWNDKKGDKIKEIDKFYQKLLGLNSYYLHIMKGNTRLNNNINKLKASGKII